MSSITHERAPVLAAPDFQETCGFAKRGRQEEFRLALDRYLADYVEYQRRVRLQSGSDVSGFARRHLPNFIRRLIAVFNAAGWGTSAVQRPARWPIEPLHQSRPLERTSCRKH